MTGFFRTLLVCIACATLPQLAHAQSYPTRPIRLVVPFPPGGGADITARILADGLGPVLGQTAVVDNRAGAASILGTDIVSKAAPDGYTLLVATISLAFNAALYKKLPYDTLRDLIPISLVTDQPNILVANPSLPARSFKEFIGLARAAGQAHLRLRRRRHRHAPRDGAAAHVAEGRVRARAVQGRRAGAHRAA